MLSKWVGNLFAGYSALALLVPSVSLAAGGLVQIVPCGNDGQPACGVCDLAHLANNALTDSIYIAIFLSAILFAWAGLKYLTSLGSSSSVTHAKEIFSNVGIGLVIILVSWLVVNIVITSLTSLTGWNKICMLLLQASGLA